MFGGEPERSGGKIPRDTDDPAKDPHKPVNGDPHGLIFALTRVMQFLKVAIFSIFVLTAFDVSAKGRKIVILTDIEPDDRIALHLLAANFLPEEILLIGTTVMNAAEKRVLVQRLMRQLGFGSVPVAQGTGFYPSDYPEIQATKPARNFLGEGKGILSSQELNELMNVPRTSMEFQQRLQSVLEQNEDVEFLVLAPPTDLVAVLEMRPDLKRKIKHIGFMGGWSEVKDEAGQLIRRLTYNGNMEPLHTNSTRKLMKMEDLPITVFSFHAIKLAFPERSINPGNYPDVWNIIDRVKLNKISLQETSMASALWDQHILESLPPTMPPTHPLKVALTQYQGRQFAPADPLVVAAMLDPHLIQESRLASIDIDINDIDPTTGIRVYVQGNAHSQIRVVEQISAPRFINILKASFLKFDCAGALEGR